MLQNQLAKLYGLQVREYFTGADLIFAKICHIFFIHKRGFGGPQAMFVAECMVERVANELGLDSVEVG